LAPQQSDHPLGRRAIGAAVPVARFFGVDVFAHWTIVIVPFAILAALATLVTGQGLTAGAALGWAVVWTVATILVIASHELAHTWAACRAGTPVGAVVLTPLGPISHDDPPTPTPGSEVLVNLAGALVHALWLVPAALAVYALGGATESAAPELMARTFFAANLALAVLNVLPFYPLDGGRALRGFLTTMLGRRRAELWTAYLGYAGAVVLGLIGLTLLLYQDPQLIGWALVLIAVGITNLIAAQRLLFSAQFLGHPRPDPQPWGSPLRRAPDVFDEAALSEMPPPPAKPARQQRIEDEQHVYDEDDDEETLVESAEERMKRLTERVDQLLDRINEVGGLENLTPAERRELADASEMLRGEAAS